MFEFSSLSIFSAYNIAKNCGQLRNLIWINAYGLGHLSGGMDYNRYRRHKSLGYKAPAIEIFEPRKLTLQVVR
jgi:hypothetical protein